MIPLNGIQAGPSFQKDIGTVTTTAVTTVTSPRTTGTTVATVANPRTTVTTVTVATLSFDFSQYPRSQQQKRRRIWCCRTLCAPRWSAAVNGQGLAEKTIGKSQDFTKGI